MGKNDKIELGEMKMKSKEIKAYIESQFPCQVGFIKARVFHELKDHLVYSKEKGYDSGLIHESPEERINPFLLHKEAKTIIVIIFPYQHRDEHLRNKRHIVSRSSWGIDYHLVIQENLKQISTYLSNHYKANSITLVDNHMLHDRHMAMLAGLGHPGKNTLLINKTYGSFFFISSILTDIELDENEYNEEKPKDICGTCNKCLRACPTDAISEERYINAKRCLAYITQSKELIEDEFIDKLSKFTFGCDFCQLACPYNKDIETDIFYKFQPIGKEVINVKNLYDLSNKEFKKQYGDLSGSFRGKNVLLRNALVISANTNNKEDLSVINEINDHGNDYLKQAIDYAKNKLNKGD
jgi:epoxyqueuosine reductase